jgi:predicted ArsR family transcriptional regulator
MFKLVHHPKAFLNLKRNIQPGLAARTKILFVLEKRISTTRKISRETGLSYTAVLYHLHLLEAENILSRRGRRPYVWQLTGAGQQRLIDCNRI